jgi:hypothetical protein
MNTKHGNALHLQAGKDGTPATRGQGKVKSVIQKREVRVAVLVCTRCDNLFVNTVS